MQCSNVHHNLKLPGLKVSKVAHLLKLPSSFVYHFLFWPHMAPWTNLPGWRKVIDQHMLWYIYILHDILWKANLLIRLKKGDLQTHFNTVHYYSGRDPHLLSRAPTTIATREEGIGTFCWNLNTFLPVSVGCGSLPSLSPLISAVSSDGTVTCRVMVWITWATDTQDVGIESNPVTSIHNI